MLEHRPNGRLLANLRARGGQHTRRPHRGYAPPWVELATRLPFHCIRDAHAQSLQCDKKEGIYGFFFCVDDDWRDGIINDQLFIVALRWESLDQKQRALCHKDRGARMRCGCC